MHDGAFVVAELAVAQARYDAAGRRDERVAGGDQVQELHRPVDVADRRGDGAGLLEVLAGLPPAFDLVAGGVVRHRPEGDVRAPEQPGGHLGRDVLVTGQLLDRLHLVRLGDTGDDRGPAKEVRGDGCGDLVLPGQFLHRPDFGPVLDLRDDRGTPQQITGDGGGDLFVLGERVNRADLLLRGDRFDDLPADPPVRLVRRPAGLALGRAEDGGEPFLVVGDGRQDLVDRERHARLPPVLRPLRRGPTGALSTLA